MGGIVSGGSERFSPATPTSGGKCANSVRVKQVFSHSSSSWSLVPLESASGGGGFSPKRRARACGICLGGSQRPNIILRDTTGDGRYDTVEHVSKGGPAAPNLAMDMSGDGEADTMLLDGDADGCYDQVIHRDKAPLSFLAGLSMDGWSASSSSGSRPPSSRGDSIAAPPPPLAFESEGLRRAAISADPSALLAPGWEQVWSNSQNAHYYCHRASRRATWNRTEAVVGDEQDEDGRALSPGWEVARSKSTDSIYYHHLASGRTTWNSSEARIGYPSYWRHASQTSSFLDLVHGGPAFRQVQMLLSSTFLTIRTRDRKSRLPLALEAVRIWRIENSTVWQKYASHRAGLQEMAREACTFLPGCSPPAKTQELLPCEIKKTMYENVNEIYLFHGTSPSGVAAIARQGFDIRRAAGTACYGQGVYFSECSSKSDEYAAVEEEGLHKGLCAMLLCRVSLGTVLTWPHAEFSEELKVAWNSGHYHSILGDRQQLRGTYREFVLPPKSCFGSYPEYLIVYKRIFDDDCSDSGSP